MAERSSAEPPDQPPDRTVAPRGRRRMPCDPWPSLDASFPWGKALALGAITLSESMSSTVLYSFVPFMVRDFGVPERDVGFAAGVLASAYNIAQLPAGILWGKASDVLAHLKTLG